MAALGGLPFDQRGDDGGAAKPSIVSISPPTAALADMSQACTGLPFRIAVQAPQVPSTQPNRTPAPPSAPRSA
jgi:hypothetical protein